MIIGTDFQKGGISVFVVSDQEILRQALVHLLRVEADYTVIGDSGVVGVESVAWSTPPAVVLIHAGSEIESLIELVQRLKSRDIPAVILLHERHPWLVHAFRKAGAFGLVLLEGRAAHLRSAIYAAALRRVFLDPLLFERVLETISGQKPGECCQLSFREAQVLKHVAFGCSNAQIAQKLKVSAKSVETYRARLMGKLQLHDRRDIVRFALMTGVLSTNDGDESLV
jgi:two-component system, NarL family, response regulator NreC